MWGNVTIELVGRTSYWRRRLRADGRGPIRAAWLRHPTHGTAGIYIPEDLVGDPSLLPNRKLVYVRGVLAPIRAAALEDDPLLAEDRSVTPLVLAVQHIDLWDRVTLPTPLVPQEVRVRAPRLIPRGYLAQTAIAPDLSFFSPSMRANGGVLSWDLLHGVLVAIGRKRYLRYVLATRSEVSLPVLAPASLAAMATAS